MKEYIFGLDADDYDSDVHEMSGLFDVFDHPIIRRSAPTQTHPIGFGREKEWNEFERTSVASTDTRQPFGEGKTGGFRKFKAGNFSLSQI